MVEQWVSDLEDESATIMPRVGALEIQLKKVVESLENFENQSRRQNVRIVAHRTAPTNSLTKRVQEPSW